MTRNLNLELAYDPSLSQTLHDLRLVSVYFLYVQHCNCHTSSAEVLHFLPHLFILTFIPFMRTVSLQEEDGKQIFTWSPGEQVRSLKRQSQSMLAT